MFKKILILALSIGLMACSKAETQLPKDLEGWTVIDVRSPEEFASGHLSQAQNIPVQEIQKIESLGLAKDTHILLYCRSGRRSGIAQEALQKMGYQHLYNGGAYLDLKNRYP